MMSERIVHFYKHRNYRTRKMTVLCQGDPIEAEVMLRGYGYSSSVLNGTTSPGRVTCVECLKTCLVREERKLETLRQRIQQMEAGA